MLDKSSLENKVTFKECFVFPISTHQSRKDLIVGALLLFTLPLGWIFNLGHRLDVIYRVFHGDPPYFRGFSPISRTFSRGFKAACAIALYLSPSLIFAALAIICKPQMDTVFFALMFISMLLFVTGVFALPGGMTYNAAFNDISYLYRPDKALRRAIEGGPVYIKAWLIALTAIALSFLGLLIFIVGFFFTSVWAWQAIGFAFSKALVLTLKSKERRLM